MQIVIQDKYVTFISEDPTVNEENKVQSFYWVDIDTLSFDYSTNKLLQTFSNILKVIGGFLIGADTSSALNKTVTIHIYLKNGTKVSEEYLLSSIRDHREFEQKLLSYLRKQT